MPVNLLLCEGADNSTDVRVLRKLLAGRCEVRPEGSKYGMGIKVLAERNAKNNPRIAGMLDGDFQPEWDGPTDAPCPWEHRQRTIQFGWRWRRKEIENYLLDPKVVLKSLGLLAPPEHKYAARLEKAAETLSSYQAARTALSNCRPRFRGLPSKWGPEKGLDHHQFPNDLNKQACRRGIDVTVEDYRAAHEVTVDGVLERFEQLLPECSDNGLRRRHFLWTYAGKDLFFALEDALREFGFPGSAAFRERVLLGIENTDQDIAGWIPEWSALRTAIEEFAG